MTFSSQGSGEKLDLFESLLGDITKTRREIRGGQEHDHPIMRLVHVVNEDSTCSRVSDTASTRDSSSGPDVAVQLDFAWQRVRSLETFIETKREESRSFAKSLVEWVEAMDVKIQDVRNEKQHVREKLDIAGERLALVEESLLDERERRVFTEADRDTFSQQFGTSRASLESLHRAHARRVEQQELHKHRLEQQKMDLQFRLDDSATSYGDIKCNVAPTWNAKERAMLAESGAHADNLRQRVLSKMMELESRRKRRRSSGLNANIEVSENSAILDACAGDAHVSHESALGWASLW